MYIYLYIYINIYIYIYVYLSMYIYIYIWMHIYMNVFPSFTITLSSQYRIARTGPHARCDSVLQFLHTATVWCSTWIHSSLAISHGSHTHCNIVLQGVLQCVCLSIAISDGTHTLQQCVAIVCCHSCCSVCAFHSQYRMAPIAERVGSRVCKMLKHTVVLCNTLQQTSSLDCIRPK